MSHKSANSPKMERPKNVPIGSRNLLWPFHQISFAEVNIFIKNRFQTARAVCDQDYYVTFTDFCRVIHKRKHTRN